MFHIYWKQVDPLIHFGLDLIAHSKKRLYLRIPRMIEALKPRIKVRPRKEAITK